MKVKGEEEDEISQIGELRKLRKAIIGILAEEVRLINRIDEGVEHGHKETVPALWARVRDLQAKIQAAAHTWAPVGSRPDGKLLLETYRRKPVRRLLQIDGWDDELSDDIFCADEEGHVVVASVVWELRASPWPIRIQVLEGAPKELALPLLRKGVDMLDAH